MSSGLTFGTIKRVGAILLAIAIVLAAGLVIFQAPAIFGVEENPEASITFEDQRGDGESVTVDEVSLSEGGFVVVTGSDGETLAVSDYLEAGSHENVTVERTEDAQAELVGQLTATVHRDTTDDESFAYEDSDGEEDRPYLEDGYPVSDTATVTGGTDDALDDSFTVESLSAPDSATTNETIEITAEVANPTDLGSQQSVTLRLDGAVLEQQALELGAGETGEVTFEIETTGLAPGNRTIGVYTEGDGKLDEIELTFHTTPGIEIVNGSDDSITASVATPEEGFVAVEDGNDTVVGTSEQFGPGEHDNVTVGFDENATVEDDEELTAFVATGDPSEPENATPLEYEGEPIETTFTLADVDDEDGGDGESNESETDDGE
ncbi:hypothetical protein Htur_0052 [Haloterrigena turkmenica DSM 5511]|uniref:Uncharacterized protein n=1 Tax=Haloterrigena turkmenica (strain ATCC 51198 / DSM 5511 / JCM 9101 / NCIMB 13204 / VKM B-1734 / 4k) TaxID=543526 RepID=D2RTB0_HALTV|nr:CARDB domain-containing protein [Haloterrigena turkmenica]ADB58953.1 hypothetical protein Htur_0052 [Haloterrigena turkmenica DSM 5511]